MQILKRVVPSLAVLAAATFPARTAAVQNGVVAATDSHARSARAAVTPTDLREKAQALLTATDRWTEAAHLLVEAVNVGSPTDPAAAAELRRAAGLYSYAGRTSLARSTMEQAAERALGMGDIVTAAHAWVDAAFIAIQQRDPEGIRLLTGRAEMLAKSPLLSGPQRAAILVRINPDRLADMQSDGRNR